MHSFKLHSVTMILLSSFAFVTEASGMSDLHPKRLRSNNKQNPTNVQLSDPQIMISVKSSSQDLISTDTQRTKRFAAYTLNKKEGHKDKASDVTAKNNEKALHEDNSTRTIDSTEKDTNNDPKAIIFKDRNRTRKINLARRQTLPGENRNPEVTPKTGSDLPRRSNSPRDIEKTLNRAKDEEFSETEVKDEVITEFVKSQNRPPWLSQISDDTKGVSGTVDTDETLTNKGENIQATNNVTVLDSMTENFTVSFQDVINVTSLSNITDAPWTKIPSFEVKSDDKITKSVNQPTTPVPRKDRRRRIRHEKNKNKRMNNDKRYSKLRYIKSNVTKKSSKFSESPQRVKSSNATEHELVQEQMKPPALNPDGQQERAEGSSKKSSHSNECPTCRKQGMTEQEVKMLRIGMFQDLLMKKLRIDPDQLIVEDKVAVKKIEDTLPKVPPSLIEQTYKDNSREEEKEEFYAHDQELVLPGYDMGRNCINMHATGCYLFDLEGKVKGEVASAELWLYKMRDATDISGQTFIVYELETSRKGQLMRRNLIARKDTFTKEDWVSMNITRAVKRWVDKRRGREMLALRCKTCATRNHKALYGTKHGYKPLLVIKYANQISMRRKRSSSECDPNVRCCKRPLVANFHALNMPYILSPTNLSVGYCFGFCERIDLLTYNHTSVKQNIRLSSMSGDSAMREQLKPCCVPLLLKDTFIMTSRDGYIVRQLLPKVIVEKCGCL